MLFSVRQQPASKFFALRPVNQSARLDRQELVWAWRCPPDEPGRGLATVESLGSCHGQQFSEPVGGRALSFAVESDLPCSRETRDGAGTRHGSSR